MFGFVLSRQAPLRMCLFGKQRNLPQQAKGRFKDHEVGANCIVLCIVLFLWERGMYLQ